MRALFTSVERDLAHLVNAFAMGEDMNAALRRALERNTAKHAPLPVPPSRGPIPVCDDEMEPDTVPCMECGGSGIGRETYDGLGHYTSHDCDYCNGEGWLDNSPLRKF